MMEYGMTLFFALAIGLSCLCLRRKKEEEGILDKASTTALKGILCIFIMLHNLGLDYQNNSWLSETICDHSGTVAVSMFFFLSGYGLLKGYQAKGNKFLLRLIFHNCVKLYLIAVGINLLEYFVFFRGAFDTKDTVLRILNLDLFNNFNRMNRHGWFIASILGMYVIFALVFFVFSLIKFKHNILVATLIVASISLGFYLTTLIADKGGMYTKGITCFGVGLLYAYFYTHVNKFSAKYRIPIEIITLVISIVDILVLWGTTAGYLMNFFIIALSTKYRYDNRVSLFLGNISLGVYLFLHFSTLTLASLVDNVFFWVLTNAGFIMLLATILYGVVSAIEKGIKKITESKNRQNEIV